MQSGRMHLHQRRQMLRSISAWKNGSEEQQTVKVAALKELAKRSWKLLLWSLLQLDLVTRHQTAAMQAVSLLSLLFIIVLTRQPHCHWRIAATAILHIAQCLTLILKTKSTFANCCYIDNFSAHLPFEFLLDLFICSLYLQAVFFPFLCSCFYWAPFKMFAFLPI